MTTTITTRMKLGGRYLVYCKMVGSGASETITPASIGLTRIDAIIAQPTQGGATNAYLQTATRQANGNFIIAPGVPANDGVAANAPFLLGSGGVGYDSSFIAIGV